MNRRGLGDRHCLRDAPDRQRGVHPGRGVDLKNDVLAHVRAEPAQFDFDGIVAGRQTRKIVDAGLVGDRRAGGARRRVRRSDRRAREHGALTVSNSPCEPRRAGLRPRERRGRQQQSCCNYRRKARPIVRSRHVAPPPARHLAALTDSLGCRRFLFLALPARPGSESGAWTPKLQNQGLGTHNLGQTTNLCCVSICLCRSRINGSSQPQTPLFVTFDRRSGPLDLSAGRRGGRGIMIGSDGYHLFTP